MTSRAVVRAVKSLIHRMEFSLSSHVVVDGQRTGISLMYMAWLDEPWMNEWSSREWRRSTLPLLLTFHLFKLMWYQRLDGCSIYTCLPLFSLFSSLLCLDIDHRLNEHIIGLHLPYIAPNHPIADEWTFSFLDLLLIWLLNVNDDESIDLSFSLLLQMNSVRFSSANFWSSSALSQLKMR